MIPCTDLIAHGRRICASLGGTWYGRYGVCRCPAHSDRNPSLSVRIGDRALLFKCHAGCGQADVLSALRQHKLTPDVRAACPQPSVFPNPQWPLRLWLQACPIEGTPAAAYLHSRHLVAPAAAPLRYLPRCRHSPTGRWLPALLGACQSLDGTLVAVHRIYLDPDGPRLSRHAPARMLTNPAGRAAVQLAPATRILGLAEGIETALAASQLHSCPVWAALTSSRLHQLEIPPAITTLLLFGDNDPAGRAAVGRACRAYAAPQRTVTARFPPLRFNDWNDVLKAR